jgi:nicotinamide phosphoribosyltransferase
MKATYGEITNCACKQRGSEVEGTACSERNSCIEPREIFKDPITDDGTKKSKKGLLRVSSNKIENKMEDSKNGYPGSEARYADDGSESILIVLDQQTWEQEQYGLLTTVFKDGKLVKQVTLEEIRNKLNNTK